MILGGLLGQRLFLGGLFARLAKIAGLFRKQPRRLESRAHDPAQHATGAGRLGNPLAKVSFRIKPRAAGAHVRAKLLASGLEHLLGGFLGDPTQPLPDLPGGLPEEHPGFGLPGAG